MSIKINKNSKEYSLGFVPQSLYDDVEDLKDGKVDKSGDTMRGGLTINNSAITQLVCARSHSDTTDKASEIEVGNNIPEGTAGCSSGRINIYGANNRLVSLRAGALTSNRTIEFPDKGGTVALTSNIDDAVTRSTRANVSVLTYATSLSEGIHFYTTVGNTADNPGVGSHMFMIFRASTGITVFGMALSSRDAFLNASANNGSTWGGWKAFSLV